jgi:probable HAF family extracellular repeat protein
MKQFSAIAQTFILTSFSVLSLLAVPAQAASFMGLGSLPSDIPSPYISANGISADGSVVVGVSQKGVDKYEAFRWTQAEGMVSLNFLPSYSPDIPFSYISANGVSGDGSVIVGFSLTSNKINTSYYEAFRWTQAEGMVGLGHLSNDDSDSRANGISADGSVIVGSNRNEAFRWTQETGMVSLGFLANQANGVSSDGSVIVGSGSTSNVPEPFRWTQLGGMVGLGSLAGSLASTALGISADGSVAVGSSYSATSTYEAFRWTQSGGIVGLGYLSSDDFDSQAYNVSGDGSVVVGYSRGSNRNEAFRWTQETGMVSLKETLIGAGLDVSGWTLSSANAISADGFTIVGSGTNPSGQSEAWVANLEPIPEPLTILGSIAAIAFAAGFERKFNKNKSDEKDPDA